MRYLSVCSGIEAATVAWHPLGWQAVAYSEIDAFPAAVLAHHYPDVPNHGDMTKFEEWPNADVDVLVGGTPCQSFSVAGLRAGLADPRGNLMLTYLAIAGRYRPRWLVWENVPGVLSSNKGRDFGTFLWALGELGYGFAYRVLDAQYFGLAQRRKRVFVVGHLGDWRRAAAVLFERESLRGDSAPSRKAGEETAGTLASRTDGGGFPGTDESCGGYIQPVANVLTARMHKGINTTLDEGQTLIARPEPYTLAIRCRDDGNANAGAHTFDARQSNVIQYGDKSGPLDTDGHTIGVAIPIISDADREDSAALTPSPDAEGRVRLRDPGIGIGQDGDPMFTLQATKPHAVAFHENQRAEVTTNDTAGSLKVGGGKPGQGYPAVMQSRELGMQVRRLTTTECERLMGFPDGYTDVPYRGKPAADGPRYKALGNSMAVPCMLWLGKRIQMVEDL